VVVKIPAAGTIEVTRRAQPLDRDRAMRRVRLGTGGAVGAALGLTSLFSATAAITFPGKHAAAAATKVPAVPTEAAPVQTAPPAPPVIVRVVHHAYDGPPVAAAPQAPGQAPAPVRAYFAPPPPRPLCHSTPSHSC